MKRIGLPFVVVVLSGIFVFAGPTPVPLVDQPLVPMSISPGSGAFSLTVHGANFASGAIVEWNGSARPTHFVSRAQLIASISASDVATAGTAAVSVVNLGGTPASNIVWFPITTPVSVGFSTGGVSTHDEPLSIASGDLNGDGILDLVTDGSYGIYVSFGVGAGKFRVPMQYAIGPTGSVTVADFNGDQKLDVAVFTVDQSGNFFVAVLLNNGNGTLGSPLLSPISGGLVKFVPGDFDGDGKLDVAIVNGSFPGTVSVLLGNGDGTFTTQFSYIVDNFTRDIVTADFNGDGILDLGTANSSGMNVSILLGKGDGTFLPAVNYFSGRNSSFLTAADFNGDGKLDLAVSKLTTSHPLAILLGNGDGSFQPRVNYETHSGTQTPAVGDFNGDGKIDIALAGRGPIILLGNGDGTFQSPLSFQFNGLYGLTVADFNNDGRLDLAGPGFASGRIAVFVQK